MAYNRTSEAAWATDPEACAVEQALACISGRWKMRIFHIISQEQTARYCLINNLLSDISEKTLTAQLREMEKDGIISRTVYPEVPPRVDYQLTKLGVSLQTVFDALEGWGKAFMTEKAAQQYPAVS